MRCPPLLVPSSQVRLSRWNHRSLARAFPIETFCGELLPVWLIVSTHPHIDSDFRDWAVIIGEMVILEFFVTVHLGLRDSKGTHLARRRSTNNDPSP